MRHTVVVHTKLASHMARVGAARYGSNGLQILTMSHLAARLAGGFVQAIDTETLQRLIRVAINCASLGEFDAIKALPGMVGAAAVTLEKDWAAGIDLASLPSSRTQALLRLEAEVLRSLPPSMKPPGELVALARERIRHAPAVLGPIEVHGHSEMSPCWRPLLAALATQVPIIWVAGARPVPSWLREYNIKIEREPPNTPAVELFSCATPYHEALEAFRWMRELLASGKARPEEIAIVAANPADFDDAFLALSAETNLPLHFVHGVRALTTRDGQTAAALAEAMIFGVSQERILRLFALLGSSSKATASLPENWKRVLPKDAPLTSVERWEQAFKQVAPEQWPEGVDHSETVLKILRLIERGAEAAEEAGETVLAAKPRAYWRRALADGPPEALPVTLAQLRISDGLEAAATATWTSAISLASSPRPYVRLLALNMGRWPRRISEDRLIPDHVISLEKLDPLPVSEGDRRDFETIIASAKSVALSFSRRDAGGRLLGRSPLIGDRKATYLSRGRTPGHAASEADRLLARPSEFNGSPLAVLAAQCWRDWHSRELTAHDGLARPSHPRVRKIFDRPMSATSLRSLLL